MDPLVLHEPLASAIFWTSAVAWVVGELTFMLRTRRSGEVGGERSVLALWLTTAAGLTLGVFLAANVHGARLPGGGVWPVVVGMAVFWVGVGFRIWAIRTLGRFFKFTVVFQDDHSLVEEGPYRRLRHPSYTGLLLGLTGLGIALGNWLAIVACLLPALIGFSMRIEGEERALCERFGDSYREYMGRTSRLIPGVW